MPLWPRRPFTDLKSPPTITRDVWAETTMPRTSLEVAGRQRGLST